MRLNLLKWMEMGDKEIYKFIYFFRKVYVFFICWILYKYLNFELGYMFIIFSLERGREVLIKLMLI